MIWCESQVFLNKIHGMKKITLLFFLLSVYSFFSSAQVAEEAENPQKPYVLLKDGSIVSVLKPIVVCDSVCYYVNRYSKTTYRKPLREVEAFSNRSDVRWMTKQEFSSIGTSPVRGYFLSIITIYPSGLGIFMLIDISKRRRIHNYFQYSIYGN